MTFYVFFYTFKIYSLEPPHRVTVDFHLINYTLNSYLWKKRINKDNIAFVYACIKLKQSYTWQKNKTERIQRHKMIASENTVSHSHRMEDFGEKHCFSMLGESGENLQRPRLTHLSSTSISSYLQLLRQCCEILRLKCIKKERRVLLAAKECTYLTAQTHNNYQEGATWCKPQGHFFSVTEA